MLDIRVIKFSAALYWTCPTCEYKQLLTMQCYCAKFEELRRAWAANQNIATVTT